MNTKILRQLLSSSRTTGDTPRVVTVSRSGGLLRLSVPRLTSTIRVWVDDPGDDFYARAISCEWVKRVVAALREVVVTGTSAGVNLTEGPFVASLRAEADSADVGELPDGGVTLAAADLAEMAWVAQAVASEDNRYGLSGLCVEADGTVVGTDGNRLHIGKVPALAGLTLPPRVLLPRDWFAQVRKFADKGGARIVAHGGNVYGIGDGWAVRARTITADFPDYRQVLPKAQTAALTVPAATLRAALTRLAAAAQKTHNAGVVFAQKDDGLVLTHKTSERHTLADSVPLLTGDLTMPFMLNVRFVLQALDGCDGDVKMTFREKLTQVEVIAPSGRLAIVMPIRQN